MYPRKGAIVPGADADLCIYDPTGTSRISAKTHHQNVDRNIFEGFETKGKVATTVVAGRVQWHDGDLRVERGAGKYIKRTGG
jgi:dihydropyrimidinase